MKTKIYIYKKTVFELAAYSKSGDEFPFFSAKAYSSDILFIGMMYKNLKRYCYCEYCFRLFF
jgi:hypothetical protein